MEGRGCVGVGRGWRGVERMWVSRVGRGSSGSSELKVVGIGNVFLVESWMGLGRDCLKKKRFG